MLFMLTHIFSSFILSITSVWVGFKFFGVQPLYRRWLWVLLIGIFGITALSGLFYFLGAGWGRPVLDFFRGIEITAGYLFLVVLCWGLVSLTDLQPWLFIGTIGLGGALFYFTWAPDWRLLHPVIQSFCLIVAMLIAVFGMARRQRSGFWMVLALMCLAFSLKTQLFEGFMHPVDATHYLKALGLYCTGRALLTQHEQLL